MSVAIQVDGEAFKQYIEWGTQLAGLRVEVADLRTQLDALVEACRSALELCQMDDLPQLDDVEKVEQACQAALALVHKEGK